MSSEDSTSLILIKLRSSHGIIWFEEELLNFSEPKRAQNIPSQKGHHTLGVRTHGRSEPEWKVRSFTYRRPEHKSRIWLLVRVAKWRGPPDKPCDYTYNHITRRGIWICGPPGAFFEEEGNTWGPPQALNRQDRALTCVISLPNRITYRIMTRFKPRTSFFSHTRFTNRNIRENW